MKRNKQIDKSLYLIEKEKIVNIFKDEIKFYLSLT